MTLRLRRSELATPGSSERMIQQAASSDADLVFLDLEDAVAPPQKETARQLTIEALNSLEWGRKVRAVRINAINTVWVLDDIVQTVERAGDRKSTRLNSSHVSMSYAFFCLK